VGWIKREVGLGRKPEVLRMACILKPSENFDHSRKIIAESCAQVWEWADDNVIEIVDKAGRAPIGPDPALVIDTLAGLSGFFNAMVSVGWLRARSDFIEFPNYDRHNGHNAKARARKANLMQERRSVAKMLPSKGNRTTTREEKRREELGGDKSPPITPSISSRRKRGEPTGFTQFWKLWPPKDRKVGKPKCLALWKSERLESQTEEIVAGLRRWITSQAWAEGFDPQPARWLKEHRWTANPEQCGDSGSGMVACGPVSQAQAREILGLGDAA
jgi:hypothetical protein